MKNGVFDPGLALYLPLWKLDGGSFADRSAYGHLCTVTGALWTPQGRRFDGVDDYGVITHQAGINVGNDFTILAWINPENLSDRHAIFSERNGGASSAWQLEVGPGSSHTAVVAVSSAGHWDHETVNNAVVPNTPNFIAFTKTGTSGLIYVNAVLQVLQTDSPITYANNTDDKVFGASTTTSVFFKGVIIAIYLSNRALTPLEIQRIYLSTRWRYQ